MLVFSSAKPPQSKCTFSVHPPLVLCCSPHDHGGKCHDSAIPPSAPLPNHYVSSSVRYALQAPPAESSATSAARSSESAKPLALFAPVEDTEARGMSRRRDRCEQGRAEGCGGMHALGPGQEGGEQEQEQAGLLLRRGDLPGREATEVSTGKAIVPIGLRRQVGSLLMFFLRSARECIVKSNRNRSGGRSGKPRYSAPSWSLYRAPTASAALPHGSSLLSFDGCWVWAPGKAQVA